jgi:hypothetical protein
MPSLPGIQTISKLQAIQNGADLTLTGRVDLDWADNKIYSQQVDLWRLNDYYQVSFSLFLCSSANAALLSCLFQHHSTLVLSLNRKKLRRAIWRNLKESGIITDSAST